MSTYHAHIRLTHLTMRAVEWLRAPSDPVTYHSPTGQYACDVKLLDTNTVRVQDVRAMVRGDALAVFKEYDEWGEPRRERRAPPTLPTCPHCQVILDAELAATKQKSRAQMAEEKTRKMVEEFHKRRTPPNRKRP